MVQSRSVSSGRCRGRVAVRDLRQRRHALLRNFPVLGHARYLLEAIGPELRQYLVAANNEERPFTRDQRRWVYASAKQENNYFGFGTDNDIEYTAGYPIIHHRTFGRAVPPSSPRKRATKSRCRRRRSSALPANRRKAFRPSSVVNISAMSFGSLSGNAIAALNAGAAAADCLHNTGEGGISTYHRRGGELIFQIGTAYFGCRDEKGRFEPRPTEGPRRRRHPSARWRSSSAKERSLDWEECCRPRRCRPRSPRPAASRKGGTASAPPATPSSPIPTACSTGWSCWPPRPGCPSASRPPWAT